MKEESLRSLALRERWRAKRDGEGFYRLFPLTRLRQELSHGESLFYLLLSQVLLPGEGCFFESFSVFSEYFQKFYHFAELFRFSSVYGIRNMICEKGGVSQTELLPLGAHLARGGFSPVRIPLPGAFFQSIPKSMGLVSPMLFAFIEYTRGTFDKSPPHPLKTF